MRYADAHAQSLERPLVNPVTGGGGLRVSKMGMLRDKVSFMYTVVVCVLVIVAPPIVVGAWSIAFLLCRFPE